MEAAWSAQTTGLGARRPLATADGLVKYSLFPKVDVYAKDKDREKTLREAVRDLLKKYPKN